MHLRSQAENGRVPPPAIRRRRAGALSSSDSIATSEPWPSSAGIESTRANAAAPVGAATAVRSHCNRPSSMSAAAAGAPGAGSRTEHGTDPASRSFAAKTCANGVAPTKRRMRKRPAMVVPAAGVVNGAATGIDSRPSGAGDAGPHCGRRGTPRGVTLGTGLREKSSSMLPSCAVEVTASSAAPSASASASTAATDGSCSVGLPLGGLGGGYWRSARAGRERGEGRAMPSTRLCCTERGGENTGLTT